MQLIPLEKDWGVYGATFRKVFNEPPVGFGKSELIDMIIKEKESWMNHCKNSKMTDEREWIAGNNSKNKYARADLDTRELEELELIKEHLKEAPG